MEKLISFFENANLEFLENEKELLIDDVHETAICSSLKDYLYRRLPIEYSEYKIDIEYNKNKGNSKSIKHVKSILGNDAKEIAIKCDLIIHSRGRKIEEDNILAVEMKKSYRSDLDKNQDRQRLIEMTKQFNQVNWTIEKEKLPRYICGYKI